MIYVSIDIETTGIDYHCNQILELGAVIEDTNNVLPLDQLPKFKCIVEHGEYHGSATALAMNQRIFEILGKIENAESEIERNELRKQHNVVDNGSISHTFYTFLSSYWSYPTYLDTITINGAGKNFGTFDKLFLEKLPWWKSLIKIRSRVIDPAILLTDWKKDYSLPNLQKCIDRVGLPNTVKHDALQDALDVVTVLREATNHYQSNLTNFILK